MTITGKIDEEKTKMNILIVHDFIDIDYIPPIRNLISILLKKKHKVTLITIGNADSIDKTRENLKCYLLPRYDGENKIKKSIDYFIKKVQMKKLVEKEMEKNDLLWTTWDSTVARLGKTVLRYKHVMQVMELTEYIPAFPHQKIFKINAKKYARHAFKVVVPEYNRAHIQKAWWDMDVLPIVLPNKPGETISQIQDIPESVKYVLQSLEREKRKIILYQGNFSRDRDLSKFAYAIDSLKEEYAFYLMGRKEGFIDELLEKYENVHYIPFVIPPYHMLITQKAYIGILPYKATKALRYSVLNALYCAPNKIFEYAECGVPMLGSDVPGLRLPFAQYNIGCICEKQSKEEIRANIKKIEENYDEISKNCKKFFDSVSLDEIVEIILHEEHKSE